jgi:class 3 adenylate cyclase/pimeloyl-ACP methyl ester carboxylesterase
MLSTRTIRTKRALLIASGQDLREDRGVGLEIRYARNGGVAIAYQLVGDGEIDLAYVPDFVSNLVYGWESRRWRDFYERLAQSFRLILFDKRGTGLSDHGGQFAALETRMEDLHAVLEAAGSSRTVLLASHEGCSMAALYAATYPERTRALILFHPRAFEPEAQTEYWRARLAELRQRWGTRELSDEVLEDTAPSLYADPSEREWFVNWLRVGAGPAAAHALHRAWVETDLREVLPAVRVPTLVMYRAVGTAERHAREVTDLITSAQALRVSGLDFQQIFLSPEIPEEVARFVALGAAPEVPDSVLATVLFTDIVGSTERAAALGDRAWRELLERHHGLVRRELARFRGEEQDTAGDGFFATFDGPARAIRCAQAVVESLRTLGLDVRAGVHTGECELHDGKVAGLAVAIGARVASAGGAGDVLVSQTVKDLVAGTGLFLADRGERELKGVPGTWRLYAATEGPGEDEGAG